MVTHFVELFWSEHCVSCTEARQIVRQVVSDRPDVALVELDVAIHIGAAHRYGLIATPATVIDGGSVIYGVPLASDLAARLDAPPARKGQPPEGRVY